MLKRTVLLTVLIVAFVLTPMLVQAQDEMEFEDFESEDGLLTLEYPAGWLTDEDSAFLPVFMAGTSEDALEQLTAEITVPESGDQLLFVMNIPTVFASEMGMEVNADTSIVELTSVVGPAFMTPEESIEGYEIEFGEAEEVELDDELVVGQIRWTDPYSEGVVMLRLYGDDLMVVLATGTAVGEFDEENMVALGEHVIASVAYDGTGEDLIAAMMAPPEIEEAPEGVTAADFDGETLVAERCTTCHTADRIENADKDEAGWTLTVDRMIGYGADLNTAERDAVIAYLSGM